MRILPLCRARTSANAQCLVFSLIARDSVPRAARPDAMLHQRFVNRHFLSMTIDTTNNYGCIRAMFSRRPIYVKKKKKREYVIFVSQVTFNVVDKYFFFLR